MYPGNVFDDRQMPQILTPMLWPMFFQDCFEMDCAHLVFTMLQTAMIKMHNSYNGIVALVVTWVAW
jgi:hypothetical protein